MSEPSWPIVMNPEGPATKPAHDSTRESRQSRSARSSITEDDPGERRAGGNEVASTLDNIRYIIF
jgi:hypothetical protein